MPRLVAKKHFKARQCQRNKSHTSHGSLLRVRRKIIEYSYNVAYVKKYLRDYVEDGMRKLFNRKPRPRRTEQQYTWAEGRWWFYDGTYSWGQYGQGWWRSETVWHKHPEW